MPLRKQPSTAAPLKLRHIAAGLGAMFDSDAIGAFERDFAAWMGSRHAIATGNGTTALYAALTAMKLMRPGRDEVILPAYTVPTLTLALNHAGLKTVLCDVARDSFNMDAESLAGAVTDRTLAIVPVHMFGVPCELDATLAIGRKWGAYVLEDACQSPGAKLGGVRTGALGDAGFFSFCKGKNLTAFHGGMVVTSNDVLAAHMRSLIDALPPRGLVYRAAAPALVTALSLAMRPLVYGLGYRSSRASSPRRCMSTSIPRAGTASWRVRPTPSSMRSTAGTLSVCAMPAPSVTLSPAIRASCSPASRRGPSRCTITSRRCSRTSGGWNGCSGGCGNGVSIRAGCTSVPSTTFTRGSNVPQAMNRSPRRHGSPRGCSRSRRIRIWGKGIWKWWWKG